VCGIYGMIGATAASAATPMAASLVHRGPDADGFAVRGGGMLGCRRLAIVDVAGGSQPVADESGDVIAVCNGEIYNHAALRAELAARGHVFRSHSDAEVLPHLYEEHGVALLDRLDGMFALALWDARRGRLLLARDRMGEKPLYHATVPQGFLFASEPKAILATGLVSRKADWSALGSYVRRGYVPNPASAFAAIGKLPPGGRLVVERETRSADRYWSLADLVCGPPVDGTFDDAVAELRKRLAHAVRSMLLGDDPVGVFLSGGLDSTAVAALAHTAGSELATFAIGFDERGFDEREHAAVAARALGTRHRTLTITPSLFLDGVRALAPLVDEPIADPAVVPTFLLSRFARQDVKAVLVGEGSDELFAGYPTYVGAALAARWARLPVAVRRAARAIAPALGAPTGNTTVRLLLRRFLEAGDATPATRHLAWTGCIDADTLAAVREPSGPLGTPPDAELPAARSELDALLGFDLASSLTDSLLPKLDRAGMAASLEARAPFLDRHVVELACRLPVEWKVHGLATKRVLRRAVADVVPRTTLARMKRGLTVPLAAWLAGPLRPFATDTLGRLDRRVFRPAAVRALLDDHVARRRDNRRELWALVMFQLWVEANGVSA
jgi:asparagine synthase (glutamine-hydrolysing)